ncbi:MAG: hypothetical protein GIW95_09585 [Candidatus Eremiobacteraeota bacterium]|nr:hypothetical protein [Candidatus Eremiobacteraeota bacterium]
MMSLVAIAALATAWLDANALTVRAQARHTAARYAALGLERAQQELIASLGAQIAGGVFANFSEPQAPPPQPACASPQTAGTGVCPLQITVSVSLDGQSSSSDGAPNVTAASAQRQTLVAETRVAATLRASVRNFGGEVLATATRRVVARTFGVPPYAAISSADEAAPQASPNADFAGTCDGSTCGADNRIRAFARCDDPTRSGRCAGVPLQPVDDFRSPAWRDGGAQTSGWSR